MNNIPIVDAHHHLWDLENEKTKYSWLMVKEGEAFGDYGAIRKSYKLEDYLNDAKNQNLIKSVHVQAEHDDDSPVSETEWLQTIMIIIIQKCQMRLLHLNFQKTT